MFATIYKPTYSCGTHDTIQHQIQQRFQRIIYQAFPGKRRKICAFAETDSQEQQPRDWPEVLVKKSWKELQALPVNSKRVNKTFDENFLLKNEKIPYGPRYRDGSLVMRNEYHYNKKGKLGIVRVPQVFKRYELCVVYNPYLKDESLQQELARLEAYLRTVGALLPVTFDMGEHEMAKPAKRAKSGRYVLMYFFMEPWNAPKVWLFLNNPLVGLENAILVWHFEKLTRKARASDAYRWNPPPFDPSIITSSTDKSSTNEPSTDEPFTDEPSTVEPSIGQS